MKDEGITKEAPVEATKTEDAPESVEAVVPSLVTPQISVEATTKDILPPTLDSPLDFSRARSLKRGACVSVSSDVSGGGDTSPARMLDPLELERR